MAWRPEEGGLRQLSEYLKNSLSGHDREKQKEAEQVSLLQHDLPERGGQARNKERRIQRDVTPCCSGGAVLPQRRFLDRSEY